MVRRPDGGLEIQERELRFIRDRYPVLGWPLIRGVVNFGGSMYSGVKALMYSAEFFPEDGEAEEEEPSKFEVWLESRQDIPGDKLACMTALIGRAAERETVRVGRNAQCPACGGKIPMTSKFCMHCGQRVKITEIAEKSGQRHMPYSTAELERAVELHRSGLTWAQVGAEMGRSKEAIRSSASRYMRIKAANERKV